MKFPIRARGGKRALIEQLREELHRAEAGELRARREVLQAERMTAEVQHALDKRDGYREQFEHQLRGALQLGRSAGMYL